MEKLLSNKNVYIVLGVIVVIFAIYKWGKKAGGMLPLPNNGSGIPIGWTAIQSIEILWSAMDGWGTDEQAIFNVLSDKTKDQLAAIYNEYLHKYNKNLFDEFKSELSGDDLNRALNYFQGVA